jgi:transposase
MDFYTELTAKNVEKPTALWAQKVVDALLEKAALDHQKTTQALEEAQALIKALKFEVDHLTRLRFAKHSEAFKNPEQRDLFEEDLSADLENLQAKAEQAQAELDAAAGLDTTPSKKPRQKSGRQKLPTHLERRDVRHDLDHTDCKTCSQPLIKISEDITEQLEIIPAQFFVNRHIRPQYVCRCCNIIQAQPIAPAVIDSSLAGTSLLSWVIIQKYVDHLPLYRIEQIAARQNVLLARSTLGGWVGKIGFALQPLVNRLIELGQERTLLHADEIPVAQLDPGSGKTKKAYIWVYLYPGGQINHDAENELQTVHTSPLVVFDYQTTRAGKHVTSFLKGWHGDLMVDGYAGYKALFTEHGGIIELACWAHARRKFFDIQAVAPHAKAQEALQYIRKLYEIEAAAKTLSIDERAHIRQTTSLPVLEAFKIWLDQTLQTSAPKSAIAKAIIYTIKRWEALKRYTENGTRPIDNNPAENAIRSIALGRKNWLFAGSELAGQRAAAIQGLLATAKLNGLNPAAWLEDVLNKLPTWPNSRIDELLPFRCNYPI